MHYISHRINCASQLRELPREYGIEVDLRDLGDRIVMQHDPYVEDSVENFETLLNEYAHGTIILNIKSERIEEKVQGLLRERGIENYFFLDSSFPMIRTLVAQGESRFAVRYSEFEPIEYAMSLADSVEWVWVDCFNRLPLDQQTVERLAEHFKICLVSPELQKHRLDRIGEFAEQIRGMPIDAICTKRPDLWKHCIANENYARRAA